MSVAADRYGFFNGIYGIEQSNWANYWRGIVPDGVIAGQGYEMAPYAQSDGMYVHVKTGQAMVDNHRVWINSAKTVALSAASSSNPRIDLLVLRVVYGNTGESYAELDIKTGTAAASPTAPTVTQTTGGTYEIALAQISVPKNAVTIAASYVTDVRYVFRLPNDSVTTFSSTSLTCVNDVEYRCSSSTALASLALTLPASPNDTFITGVCFTSSSSFGGITFKKGSSTITPKLVGDSTSLSSKRYNLVIWWDSGASVYWCAVKAV